MKHSAEASAKSAPGCAIYENGATAMIDQDERMRIHWACAELVRRSVALSDAERWDDLAALYAEDAEMSRPSDPDRWFKGRAAILESFQRRPPRTARHLIGNLVVEVVSADEARVSTTVALFIGPARDSAAPVRTSGPVVIGAYDDLLRRDGADWRIVRRAGSLALEHAPASG